MRKYLVLYGNRFKQFDTEIEMDSFVNDIDESITDDEIEAYEFDVDSIGNATCKND
ncbi:MAG: hypothetical protein ACI8WT_001789 [Clostridium sp.]|jgi:hypothetical protein